MADVYLVTNGSWPARDVILVTAAASGATRTSGGKVRRHRDSPSRPLSRRASSRLDYRLTLTGTGHVLGSATRTAVVAGAAVATSGRTVALTLASAGHATSTTTLSTSQVTGKGFVIDPDEDEELLLLDLV